MSLIQLHLMINHVPLLASVFGLLLLAWGALRASLEVKRTAYMAFVVAALFAGATFLTGEPAEEAVEGLPGVSAPAIERHEQAAGVALAAVVILGVLALAGLLFQRRAAGPAAFLTPTVVLVALATVALMSRTATLGGQIRHSEIRAGGAQAGAAEGALAPEATQEAEETRDSNHDDD